MLEINWNSNITFLFSNLSRKRHAVVACVTEPRIKSLVESEYAIRHTLKRFISLKKKHNKVITELIQFIS